MVREEEEEINQLYEVRLIQTPFKVRLHSLITHDYTCQFMTTHICQRLEPSVLYFLVLLKEDPTPFLKRYRKYLLEI